MTVRGLQLSSFSSDLLLAFQSPKQSCATYLNLRPRDEKCYDTLSCFDATLACDEQTDRQTSRRILCQILFLAYIQLCSQFYTDTERRYVTDQTRTSVENIKTETELAKNDSIASLVERSVCGDLLIKRVMYSFNCLIFLLVLLLLLLLFYPLNRDC